VQKRLTTFKHLLNLFITCEYYKKSQVYYYRGGYL
jgi:hypothetical protein